MRQNWKVCKASEKFGFMVGSTYIIYIRSLLLFRIIERSLKGIIKVFTRFERVVQGLGEILFEFSQGSLG